MKFLFDTFPVIAFFIAWLIKRDMMLATYVIIIASAIQLLIGKFVVKKVEKLHLFSFGVLFFMGGLTIALNDERFIKLKPTIFDWVLAVFFIGAYLIKGKNLLKSGFDLVTKDVAHLQSNVPESVWKKLLVVWIAWFLVEGGINLFVANGFETDVWMKFNFIGIKVMNMVFIAAQLIYLMRFITDSSEETEIKPVTEDKKE